MLTADWFFSSNVHWCPRSGLRAQFLLEFSELAADYDAVIVWCGNNDLTPPTWKRSLIAKSPDEVVLSLANFKTEVRWRNPRVVFKLIGLMPRPEVERILVQETNLFMLDFIEESYVSLKYFEPRGHFEPDGTHLNREFGLYRTTRLFQTAINTGL